jgi:hypothetical protein
MHVFNDNDWQLMVLSTVAGRGLYQLMICFLALSQGWQEFSWSSPFANVGSLLYIGCAGVLLGACETTAQLCISSESAKRN